MAQFSHSRAAFDIFFYVYHVLLAIQTKHHFKLSKNSLFKPRFKIIRVNPRNPRFKELHALHG